MTDLNAAIIKAVTNLVVATRTEVKVVDISPEVDTDKVVLKVADINNVAVGIILADHSKEDLVVAEDRKDQVEEDLKDLNNK